MRIDSSANDLLIATYSEEEVFIALKEMGPEKEPREWIPSYIFSTILAYLRT